jgi:N-acetylmuramoyl-L-alanine amidase
MKRKIFISAGHSTNPKRDRGATGNGYWEGDLTAEFRAMIVKELKAIGIDAVVDKEDSILSDSIAFFRRLVGVKDIAIDIHFNASANVSATGTEVLVPDDCNVFESSLALSLLLNICNSLGLKNRGVKKESLSARGKLGWMRLNCENILLEVCFISNVNDMKAYQNHKYFCAKQIATTLSKAI